MAWASRKNRTYTGTVLLGAAFFALSMGPGAAAQGDPSAPPGVATQTPRVPDKTAAAPETVMTRQQAKALLSSVDSVMQFVAGETGLPPVEKVKRRLVTREEVGRYLVKSFNDDESAKRLQRSEIVLKKFGLLSRDFDLKPFLLSLLTEQIAGYYDDKTKYVNLLNWVPAEEQQPVLAHELTHAVQDQKVSLEKWSNTGFHGVSHTATEDQQRVQVDELETARQAVTEGQAMVSFIDFGLKGSGRTLATSPEIGKAMKDGAADASSSPVMARAPFLLQRSLAFPYADGLGFEQALLIKGGKSLAFTVALDDPPNSSFQVMHPEAYLAHVPVPVLRLPDVHALLDAEYEPYDLGVMGELDVEIMSTLFGGKELAAQLAPAWDGGVYYAAQRKAASAADRLTTSSLAVFYLSRWKTEDAASAFARIYAGELGRKYDRLRERKADEQSGEQVYSTGEGDVLLSLRGDYLFIAEGLPVANARKLRQAAMDVQSTGPVRMAGTGELSLGVERTLGSFGILKTALAGKSYTGTEHREGN